MRETVPLTQEELAEKVGVDQTTVSRLERGALRHVRLEQVLAIEKICGKPAGWSLRKAGLITDPVDVETAIRQDVRLSDEGRAIMLATYRVAVSRSSP